jgi:hypothetical protein
LELRYKPHGHGPAGLLPKEVTGSSAPGRIGMRKECA